MILLWGVPEERPLQVVGEALERLGHSFIYLDQRRVLDTEVELYVDSELRGTLRTEGQCIDLRRITAVYLRTYDWRRWSTFAELPPDSPEWRHASTVEDVLMSWLELTPARVVNPLMAMSSNGSKPYQASRIRTLGFDVPDTLITTDPEAAQAFWALHGTVIYKSVSGIRSIVSRLTPDHVDRLQDIAWCPTQFQEYIEGHDYRVHVVGDELFASEIISQGDDYRYAEKQGASVEIRPYDLSTACADRCRALAADMELPVAGIDLRCTPEGRWYCFEVNPCPAFTYYQGATGQPIDEAIARFLAAGDKAHSVQVAVAEHLTAPSPRALNIHEVDTLTAQECAGIYQTIYDLEEVWQPSHYFGTASYIDAATSGQAAYAAKTQQLNPILRQHFAALYERVAQVLSTYLGQPVHYHDTFAVPGFHIFRCPIHNSSVHFDLQYELLSWERTEEIDFEHPLSFTLPIALPPGGAGLNLWEIHYEEAVTLSEGERTQLQHIRGKQFIPYTLGQLVVHSGHFLHQIAPSKHYCPGDERITLQGHALKCNDTWLLYW